MHIIYYHGDKLGLELHSLTGRQKLRFFTARQSLIQCFNYLEKFHLKSSYACIQSQEQ